MSGLDRYENRVWDRFFDFVTQPVEQMTREEVSNWLLMYTEVIKNSIDNQDPEIWQELQMIGLQN